MKKFISFLCRFPGVLIPTIVAIIISFCIHWQQFDNRLWLPIIIGLLLTVGVNSYAVSIPADEIENYPKRNSTITRIVCSIICIVILIAIKIQLGSVLEDTYALVCSIAEIMTVVLIWSWFALAWNERIFDLLIACLFSPMLTDEESRKEYHGG